MTWTQPSLNSQATKNIIFSKQKDKIKKELPKQKNPNFCFTKIFGASSVFFCCVLSTFLCQRFNNFLLKVFLSAASSSRQVCHAKTNWASTRTDTSRWLMRWTPPSQNWPATKQHCRRLLNEMKRQENRVRRVTSTTWQFGRLFTFKHSLSITFLFLPLL